MFIPDDSFKAKILQELEEGEKSISTLHRTLTEQGHKVHRLVLTGYLKAMEEMGILSSREFPPSKVYSISIAADKDIYETVMEISMRTELIPESQRSEIILYFFQKLFKRPVFQSELARAGLASPPESSAMDLSGEERLELKRTLAKRGVKLPMKEQAYFLKDVSFDKEYEVILQLALLNKFKASSLALDTKQTKLGV